MTMERSHRPSISTQFVIPSDRDWRLALADPQAAGVRYLLVPDPSKQLSALDAIDRTYPGIFRSGAGIGKLVDSFPGVSGSPTWHLFVLTKSPAA
jgi:hypothetical protein